MIKQKNWLNPRKDFLNYGKRLKNTYRYFGWYLANNLINAFKQDKANFEEFRQLPFHIYEVTKDEKDMPGMCGFMPGLFTSVYNLEMTKKVGEDKNSIKTIMLINFGTTIGYFYNQYIFLKKNGIDIADYLKSTSILESSNEGIPSIGFNSKYADIVSACIERFQNLVKTANNSCITSIYDNMDSIEKIYGFEINESFLPPRPVSDIIAYTESLIEDMEDRMEDEDDLVF